MTKASEIPSRGSNYVPIQTRLVPTHPPSDVTPSPEFAESGDPPNFKLIRAVKT